MILKCLLPLVFLCGVLPAAFASNEKACTATKKLYAITVSRDEESDMARAAKQLKLAACLDIQTYAGGVDVFDRGVWYYPNGTVAFASSRWYFLNGTLAYSDGIWYFPDGTIASNENEKRFQERRRFINGSMPDDEKASLFSDGDAEVNPD